MKKWVFSFIAVFLYTTVIAADDPRLLKASRQDIAGWIYIHLEGSPKQIGYQHGFLLANEIDDALKMMAYSLEHSTKKNWDFYREAVKRMFWPKMDKEYQDEI